MKTMHLLRPLCSTGILLLLLCALAACSSQSEPDLSGLYRIAYSNIDPVCEEAASHQAGEALLVALQDTLLLSHAIDRSILLEKAELQNYDHLLLVNPEWVERYGDSARLSPVALSDLSEEMQEFLSLQMPLWTKDGSVLPEGIRLCEYRGSTLPVLPPCIFGGAPLIYAENPLLILVEAPAKTLQAGSCLLPLSSSANLIFTDREALQQAFAQSGLQNYGAVEGLTDPPCRE